MVNDTKKYIIKKHSNNKTRKIGQAKKIGQYIPFEKNYTNALAKIKNYKGINNENETLLKEIKLKYSGNKNSSPQNDFYTFVNERWLKNKELHNINLTKEQKYISQVDDFRIVQDNVFNEIDTIIHSYIKNNKNKKSKCMKNFYDSVSKQLSYKQAKEYISYYINYIDEMRKDSKNLWKIIIK